MREQLSDHIGEYVFCRGWIGGWEDMDECSTRRLYIKQPTIKRANKDLLFRAGDNLHRASPQPVHQIRGPTRLRHHL